MSDGQQPEWVQRLRETYLAGGSSFFTLHGNTADFVGRPDPATDSRPAGYHVETLSDYLAQHLFGAYDLVLHYDVGRGLRVHAGNDLQRLSRMNALVARLSGGKAELPRDPTPAMRFLDRLVSLLLVSEDHRQLKTAILFDYADLICPPADREPEHLATLLNWARSPIVRRVNLIFVLMTESLARLNTTLVQSGYTEEIAIPMPSLDERRAFIAGRFPEQAADADRLAALSAGLTLANLDNMMRLIAAQKKGTGTPGKAGDTASESLVKEAASLPAVVATAPGDTDKRIVAIKKALIEAQCPGLIEFVEPKFTLDLVAGHAATRQRLTDDARLVREGQLDAVPMGYLICGPVGVGKTFIAMCYAGSVGIPCVTIRNFRSKYVGETESNIERILTVLRELGPVAVIVDEADAAVGNRGDSGDAGTSARVFAQLAAQMGDTRYRGKLIWFLLTCRPDLLPVDLKRQGRCEEHIPLFYPQSPGELREMFLAMARKAKIDLDEKALPDFAKLPPLSGADIEAILTRARRESLLRGQPVDSAILADVLKTFRSTRGPAHELQWLAGVLECTDLRYLPEDVRKAASTPEGQDTFLRRFRELEASEG
jgi:AAA+ superfamily predicted ATPase